MPRLHIDEANEHYCQIARDAGLNPDLISQSDWEINGDTITYRYVILDADGKARIENNVLLKTEQMTAKVGGGK